ncbi:MAG: hypothetical protein LBH73_09115, partial [Spirochaetaceae bacterium]|nr:hypothetical protein [Spirochaetaceae bacterium]
GGIAGIGGNITGCYSTGTVSGAEYVGGIAGYIYSGYITNCAALNPTVTALTSGAGRVVGDIYGSGSSSGNIAYAGMTPGDGGVTFTTDTRNAGTGKSAGDLSTKAAYTGLGWDFDTVWEMGPGNGTYSNLPILKWQ